MPIRKYRTLSEAGRSERLQPGTPEFSRTLRCVFRMAACFAPPTKPPPGVHKFRSIEDAQARKKEWLSEQK